MARKGAQRAGEPDDRPPRPPSEPLTEEEQAKRQERQQRREQRAANQARLRSEAKDAVDRADTPRSTKKGTRARTERKDLPPVPLSLDEPEVAITRLVGADRAPRYVGALRTASQAFARERYHDARKALKPALDAVPDVAEVAELQGLIQYRLGNWKAAATQLERFRDLTGTTEQHPVLADCYRALRRYGDVDELWAELREASPSADLVTEGRIVTAGARADQGDLTGAIELLEGGWTRPKRPKPHHLRRAYALADLYERNGRAPRARELFRWIQTKDAGFADVGRRVSAL